jgi:hypothetical protein
MPKRLDWLASTYLELPYWKYLVKVDDEEG